jgi:RimJ/RimL family protein N-acetyltransferase
MAQFLPDGQEVALRPIRPADKDALASGLTRLSARSVYNRFLSPKPSFSAAELRYLTEVDGHDHLAVVVEDPDRAGRLIAEGRWVRLADDPEAAEIAITVADCWQRRGIGSLIASVLAHEAHRNGIRRFTATVAAENTAALRLLEKAAEQLHLRHNGAVDDAVIDLAA